MGECKIAKILEMASRRAKRSGYFRKYMYNLWHFGQWPSFMPKYGNFENQPVSRKPLPIEQAKFRPPEVEREYMCNFWNFGHLPSSMPKYDNFENRPVSRKPLPIELK